MARKMQVIGLKGLPGEIGPQGPKGDMGPQGPAGLDYVLTDSDKQEISEKVAASSKEEIGNLSDLQTTDKSNLVAAINEAAKTGGSGAGTGYSMSATDDGAGNVVISFGATTAVNT